MLIKVVQAFPKDKAIYAIGLAAFVLAIPVYFDVTFVILIPIGMALMKEINKSIAHVVGAITIGAAAAHTMVPPTPAPLAAGEIFGFDTGLMIAFGGIVSLIGVFVVIKIYTMILDKSEKFWKPEKDIATEAVIVKEETTNIKKPSFAMAMLPIIVPIIMIIINTVANSVLGEAEPEIFKFIGDKTTALLAGAIVAYLIAVQKHGAEWQQRKQQQTPYHRQVLYS